MGKDKEEFDNYIFDLYGTLVDIHTEEQESATWKKWMKYLNTQTISHPRFRKVRKDFAKLEKRYRKEAKQGSEFEHPEIDYEEVYRELLESYGNKDLTNEQIKNAAAAFREASRRHMNLFPGVAEYLRHLTLSGKRVYILSNAQASYTLPEIEMLGLSKMVDDVLISSDCHCMKPDSKFFELLIDKHNLDKEKTVMIGDSESCDVNGAKAVGIAAIHLAGENEANQFYLKRI